MSGLPEGWVENALDDLTIKIGSGATPRGGNSAYKCEGISLIRSQNVLDFNFTYNGLAFIDDEQADKLKNVEIESQDVLINITGDSVARVCMVPDEAIPARVNQHVAILRTDKNKLNPTYLKYYLLNPIFKRHLLALANSGGTRNALTKGQLQKLPIVHPKDIDEIDAIANILSSFDEKIELLRQQNETLENLAQTLFKEWFVNFNFPGATGLMEDTEVGVIPKGWRVTGIRDLVEHKKITVKPQDNSATVFYHYSLPAYDDGTNAEIQKGEEISSNKYKVIDKSFLVSKLNPSTPRIWTIYSPVENSVCSTEFQVIKPIKYENFGFVYGALTSYMMRRELSARAHGTSSSHQRVKPDDILDCPVFIPSEDLVKDYSSLVNKMLEKIDENRIHINKLSETRDILLPKLLNGSVRVEGFGE